MVRSFPELAAQRWHIWRHPLEHDGLSCPNWQRLAPIYRLRLTDTLPQRQRKLRQLMVFLHQRFIRLQEAWPAWDEFDVGAYFDLYPDQATALCETRVHNGKLQVVFFVDMLMPSFRRALHYWQTVVVPAYKQVEPSLAGPVSRPTSLQQVLGTAFDNDIMPEFDALYLEAHTAMLQSIRPLAQSGDVHFLAHSAACLERLRVAKAYRKAGPNQIATKLDQVPTLTLEHTIVIAHNVRRRRQMRLARYRDRLKHHWAL